MKNTVLTGIVLSATPQGEYNKIITVLTADRGLVSIYCFGAMSIKNSNFASTQPLSFSEFEVSESKDGYTLKHSSIIQRFGNSPELLQSALFIYCQEVLLYVCCRDTDESEMLRLALNTFYAIDQKLKEPQQIKGVFDLKCAELQGFAPELDCCTECNQPVVIFDLSEGGGFCKKHGEDVVGNKGAVEISPACLSAMQYVLGCPIKKMLSFSLPDDALDEFAWTCEKYLEYQLEHHFSSLEFYHSSLAISK